jgi:carbamoyltransferase
MSKNPRGPFLKIQSIDELNVLGLNLYFHDSAATLIRNGKVVAAIEEERWFRDDKHTAIFPKRSIKYCLQSLGENHVRIPHVAINMDPIRCLSNTKNFLDLMCHPNRWNKKHWDNYRNRRHACGDIQWQTQRTLFEMNLEQEFQFHLVAHHDSHAASAFFVSPFEEAAVLAIDANGEWPTTSTYVGRGNRLQRLQTLGLPNSLGGLYGTLTTYLGFKRNSDEFKVMGLAAYGNPKRYRKAMNQLIHPTNEGFFKLNQSFFDYAAYKITTNHKVHKLLEILPRIPGSEISDQHKDIAAALQERTEEIVIHVARHLQQRTGLKKLCLAGGVALNCVMNTAILNNTDFEEIFIQPASHDAGSALGAAYWVYHQILGKPRNYTMDRVDYGPSYSDDEIEAILRAGLLRYKKSKNITHDTAKLLSEGKIIGWFQGRAEFGPRALGYRSILADPTRTDMQDHLNLRVKHREDFRPFAPASTIEDYSSYFDAAAEDFFMTKICKVREEYRERLPAITHIDGTARLQTVRSETNPLFHRLIKEFESLRGLPVIINTSFNVNGEPMVLTPQDALRCFFTTGIDCLAIGNFIIHKEV